VTYSDGKSVITPLIIEFFGIPGSGKTTIQRKLSDRLRNQGNLVATREDLFNWAHSRSKLYKTILIIKEPIWVISIVISLIRLKGVRESISRDRIIRILSLIKFPIYLKKFYETNHVDIILLDQGMIQAFWSILYGLNSQKENGIENIVSLINGKMKVQYLHFQISIDEAVHRIVNRTSGNSRFDGIKDHLEVKYLLSDGDKLMMTIINLIPPELKLQSINAQRSLNQVYEQSVTIVQNQIDTA